LAAGECVWAVTRRAGAFAVHKAGEVALDAARPRRPQDSRSTSAWIGTSMITAASTRNPQTTHLSGQTRVLGGHQPFVRSLVCDHWTAKCARGSAHSRRVTADPGPRHPAPLERGRLCLPGSHHPRPPRNSASRADPTRSGSKKSRRRTSMALLTFASFPNPAMTAPMPAAPRRWWRST
jgi:hypothetical protein